MRWSNFLHQLSHAILKSAVLCGVDEGVDTAVHVHQYSGDVVEPTPVVDIVADDVHEEVHLIQCPAGDESTADHQ